MSEYVTYYRGEDVPIQVKKMMDYADWLLFKNPQFNSTAVSEAMIAGGIWRSFLTSQSPNDVDLFFPSEFMRHAADSAMTISQKIVDKGGNIYRYHAINNAETIKFNLIRDTYPTPEAVLDKFDFTVCCCAVTKDAIIYHPTFFMDLASKSLIVNNIQDPLKVLYRLNKYMGKYGFTTADGTMHKIATAIWDLETTPPLKVEEPVPEIQDQRGY